jgi:hypothetical protein
VCLLGEPILRVAVLSRQRHDGLIAVGAICGGREAVAQAQDLQPQMILTGLDRPSLETILSSLADTPGEPGASQNALAPKRELGDGGKA